MSIQKTLWTANHVYGCKAFHSTLKLEHTTLYSLQAYILIPSNLSTTTRLILVNSFFIRLFQYYQIGQHIGRVARAYIHPIPKPVKDSWIYTIQSYKVSTIPTQMWVIFSGHRRVKIERSLIFLFFFFVYSFWVCDVVEILQTFFYFFSAQTQKAVDYPGDNLVS